MRFCGQALYRFGGTVSGSAVEQSAVSSDAGMCRAAVGRIESKLAMTARRSHVKGAILLIACLGRASTLHAQGIEVTPFGGYRFGGDFFEIITGQPVDTDGAPAVGAIVDIPLGEGLQVEGLFTHQDAHVSVETTPLAPPLRARISVDHFQGGALQEYADGRVRPFATGMLGLTRYAGEGDSEIRFTLGAGGGVKLFATERVGVRL